MGGCWSRGDRVGGDARMLGQPGEKTVGRPKPIEWPNKAKICVTFIVPWEIWPENFATRDSLQRSSHSLRVVRALARLFLRVLTRPVVGRPTPLRLPDLRLAAGILCLRSPPSV